MISDFYTDTAFTPDKWETLPPPADLKSFSKTEQLRREFHLPKENFLDETMARTPFEMYETLKDEEHIQETLNDGEWYEFGWVTLMNPRERWNIVYHMARFFLIAAIFTPILIVLKHNDAISEAYVEFISLIVAPLLIMKIAKYKMRKSDDKYNIGFNRKTGMVSIPRKGQEPFVAPFYEFIPYYYPHHIMMGVNYHLYLGHRHKEIGAVNPNAGKHPQEMYADWALIQRLMDVSKPLPDIPMFEPFRQLDPTTKAYDTQTGRPEHYWRDMDIKRANKLHDASYKRIRQFPAFDQSKWRVAPIEATQWPAIENL